MYQECESQIWLFVTFWDLDVYSMNTGVIYGSTYTNISVSSDSVIVSLYSMSFFLFLLYNCGKTKEEIKLYIENVVYGNKSWI